MKIIILTDFLYFYAYFRNTGNLRKGLYTYSDLYSDPPLKMGTIRVLPTLPQPKTKFSKIFFTKIAPGGFSTC